MLVPKGPIHAVDTGFDNYNCSKLNYSLWWLQLRDWPTSFCRCCNLWIAAR